MCVCNVWAQCVLLGMPHSRSVALEGRLMGCLYKCHDIFFHESSSPKAPENNVRIISNFYENLRRYLQVKVHHQYQQHLWEICHLCQLHQWQICHWYQRHWRLTFPPVPLVLLILIANLQRWAVHKLQIRKFVDLQNLLHLQTFCRCGNLQICEP
jgi:hypothetical protein